MLAGGEGSPETEVAPYGKGTEKSLGRNGFFTVPRADYTRLIEAVAQDACRTGICRGLLVAAGPRPEIFRQIFTSFESPEHSRVSVFIIGPGPVSDHRMKNLTHVPTEDDWNGKETLLYSKEDGGYGIFARERDEDMRGFHTADKRLVEVMLEKIGEIYPLPVNV